MSDSRNRLGRGLASLLGQETESLAVPAGGMREIAVDRLVANPKQPRSHFDAVTLNELATSIAERGILQPLLVRPSGAADRFEIVAGERRWRAAQQVGLATVPCLIVSLDDDAAAFAALVENLQRDDLDVLDEAEGFRLIMERFGLSHEALGRAIGKSRSHVANTVRLLSLQAPIRDALRNKTITAGHARALLTHPEPLAALDRVLRDDLSVRQTETLHPRTADGPSASTGQAAASKAASFDIDTASLERDLSQRLGLLVHIRQLSGRGRLVIAFQTHEQLEGLVMLLAGNETPPSRP